MSGASFNAGRDNKGAFATGAGSTATATITETTAPDPSVNIQAELEALQHILAALPALDPKALTRLDEARQEAAKPDPNRGEVGQLIAQATEYASGAAGFADAAEHLTPHLQQVASWLGNSWPHWASSIGLG